MIKEAENSQRIRDFLYTCLLNTEEKNVEKKEVEEWVSTLFKDEKDKLFEVSKADSLIGVFHCTIWETTLHLNFVYYTQDVYEIFFEEIFSFLKGKYKGYSLEYLFHEGEEQVKIFQSMNAELNVLSHILEWSPYLSHKTIEESKYSLSLYDESYTALFKKLKMSSYLENLEDKHLFIATKKHKPIGFISISIEKDTIYIDELKVLPKYQAKGVKEFLIQSVSKKYAGFEIYVIVSHYDEEEIQFYQSLGFEMNQKSTLIQATLVL
ncbi:MAG: GNAT family N-acetyltransferase [Anaeroplasmataceae bacterium]|nr:GNAT family N-acetyltransferase [Anaeroplasmataceae bacterium]